MTLLSLTADELRQQIDGEIASNPALELTEERRCPNCHRLLPARGMCPVCSQPSPSAPDEPVVFVSPREDFYSGGASFESENQPEDDFSQTTEDLPTYVLRQIAPELDIQDRRMAAYLLTHLDDDGFLTIPLIEVARYFHVLPSKIEQIQKIIQRADPLGVGSTSPQTALLAQMEVLAENGSVPELALQIVKECMDLMVHRQVSEIAHHCDVTVRQVQQAMKFIGENLNPYPGRSHWGDMRQPAAEATQVYHRPDIIINYLNDDPKNPLSVEIIMPLFGTLQVNPLFRQAMQQASEEQRENWKNDMERASLFVKCLQQRNHTMKRLMQKVVSVQKDYILYGEKHLKPVTRASLAVELEVHESTISRAVANKTVQLPNRKIVPLSSFFDRSLNVRSVLREMIINEAKPLSDTELAEMLSEKGFDVARRTVAKYRAMEGILPAHLRHAVAMNA